MNYLNWLKILLFTSILMAGCSKKIFSPYAENFGCPDGFVGDCSSVSTAYKKSIRKTPSDENFSPLLKKKTENRDYDFISSGDDGVSTIPDDEFIIPKISKVKKYRVLIPGYIDADNMFYGKRTIYFLANQPHWVVND